MFKKNKSDKVDDHKENQEVCCYSLTRSFLNQVRYRPDPLRTLFVNAAVPLRIPLVSVLSNPAAFAIVFLRTPLVSVLSVRLIIPHHPLN